MSDEMTGQESRDLMEWALGAGADLGLDPLARLVLVTLATHRIEGRRTVPTTTLLALDTGLSRPRVIEHMHTLQALGLVTDEGTPLELGTPS